MTSVTAAGMCTLIILLAACGGDRQEASRATVRDSAGVTIVENSTPVWPEGEGWRLSESPRTGIGIVEGDPHYQFANVARAVRLGDGRIVVANGGSHELRFYDGFGVYLAASGAEGGGPGEFQALSWMGKFAGDSLIVYDANSRRVSVFDPAGSFARSATLPAGGIPQLSRFVGRLADGSLVMSASTIAGPSGLIRPPITYVRVGEDGALLDTIGTFVGEEALLRTSARGSSGMFSFSIRRGGLYRSPVSAVYGNSFYYGSSDTYEIGIYDPSGALQRSIRRAQPIRKVTQDDIGRLERSAVEAERERTGSVTPEARNAIKQRLAEQPLPEALPAYRSILVDATGDLWVGEFDLIPGEQPSRWTVFDRDGHMLGTMTMPTHFTPYEIGADYVLGAWRDDLDVEYVRLYGLEKQTNR